MAAVCHSWHLHAFPTIVLSRYATRHPGHDCSAGFIAVFRWVASIQEFLQTAFWDQIINCVETSWRLPKWHPHVGGSWDGIGASKK
jgi:hypothetical protein